MPKKRKNIDQIINESFSSIEEEFDFSSWDNVAKKLEITDTIDKIVLKAFEPTPQELPNEYWIDMNDSLDIETVWKRLEKHPKRRPFIFWWKVAGWLLLIGLFTGQLINYSKLSNNTPIIANIQHKKDVSNEKLKNKNQIVTSDNQKKNVKSLNKKTNYKINQEKEVNSKKTTSQKKSTNKSAKRPTTRTKNKILTGKNNNSSYIIDPIKVRKIETLPTQQDKLTQLIKTNSIDNIPYLSTRRFTIGIIGIVDNTWISDSDTRLGFSQNSLVYNNIVFSPSIGVFINYDLKRNNSINSELFLNSTQKTVNNLFIEGELTRKESKIEYFKSNFLIAKNVPFGKRTINAVQFSAGGYIAFMRKSSIHYFKNSGVTSKSTNYKSFDYGVVASISHQINLRRFVFNYGIHSSYGFNNIFKGSTNIPSYLNKTHNINYGAHLKLGYKL